MRNVAPSRSLVRRANQVKTLALLVLAVGVFVTAVGVFLSAVPLVYYELSIYPLYTFVSSLALVVGIGLLVLALALAIRAFTWRIDNDLALTTGNFLASYLNDSFTLIRNVSKRQIGYVDAVLVGPPGVLVFRLLDNEGSFVNEGANWLKRSASGEVSPARINPTREAVADIRKVREYLEKRGLTNVPVYGVVVFIKDLQRVQLSSRDPVVPPTNLPSLVANLRDNYLAKDRIDPAAITESVRLLYGE